MNRFAVVLSLVVVSAISGCATPTVTSRSIQPIGDEEPVGYGISYYLPKRYAKVSFERSKMDDPAGELATARTNASSAKKAEANAVQAHETAKAKLTALKDSGVAATAAAYIQATVDEIEKRIAADAAKAASDAAARALASAEAEEKAWSIAQENGGYRDRFAIELLKPVPDRQQRFVLNTHHLPTRRDDWALKTTPSGLLSTLEGTVTDQSAEILVALARSATAVRGAAPNPFDGLAAADPKTSRTDDDACKNLAWKPLRIERIIDPAVKAEWEDFLTEVSTSADVAGETSPAASCRNYTFSLVKKQDVKTQEAPSELTPGIFYRRELPTIITLDAVLEMPADNSTQDAKQLVATVGTFILMLPNDAPTDVLPLPAGLFVTTEYNIGFDHGLLVSVDSDRPSELLRIASVPWEAASATMDVLTQLVQFRVNYNTQQADASVEYSRLLEQLKLQIAAEEALRQAREAARSVNVGGGESERP